MKKPEFLQTALALLEDELDSIVEKRFKSTGRCVVTEAEAIEAVVRNSNRFSKADLLKMLLEDSGKHLLAEWKNGLVYSNNLPAIVAGSRLVVAEEIPQTDLLGENEVQAKIYGLLKRAGQLNIDQICSALKAHTVQLVEAELHQLVERGDVSFTEVIDGLFPAKEYFLARKESE